MKSVMFYLLFGVPVIMCSGQFNKGNFLLGGSASGYLNSSKENAGNQTQNRTVTFSPSASYFVLDNFAIGPGANFSFQKVQNSNLSTNTYYIYFGFTPVARYYFRRFYIEATYGFGRGKSTTSYSNAPDNAYDFKSKIWSTAVGYACFIGENVAIEPRLLYQSTEYTYTYSSSLSTKTPISALSVGISFQIYLERGKKTSSH